MGSTARFAHVLNAVALTVYKIVYCAVDENRKCCLYA